MAEVGKYVDGAVAELVQKTNAAMVEIGHDKINQYPKEAIAFGMRLARDAIQLTIKQAALICKDNNDPNGRRVLEIMDEELNNFPIIGE